jgi:hypothetical protein
MERIFHWWCVLITQKQIAKFETLFVCDMLGSVFDIGDMFGSMFDFGDVFGSTSDVNKPKVCLHIWYGDVFVSMFNFGDMLGGAFVIGDAYGLHTKKIAKFEALIVSDMLGSGFYFGDVFGSVFHFGGMLGRASDVNKPTVCNLVMLMKRNQF